MYRPPVPLQLSEEVEVVRSSADVDVPLACKLDVVAGPCLSRPSYVNTEDVLEVGGGCSAVCGVVGWVSYVNTEDVLEVRGVCVGWGAAVVS